MSNAELWADRAEGLRRRVSELEAEVERLKIKHYLVDAALEGSCSFAERMEAENLELKAQRDALVEALIDATDSYAEYSAYAGEYLCKKHDVEGDLRRLRGIVARVRGESEGE